jgi:hypothetical protein
MTLIDNSSFDKWKIYFRKDLKFNGMSDQIVFSLVDRLIVLRFQINEVLFKK